ncbi:MAG TPA: ABC-2 family transporter protein [Anaerolineales bacterium]|jgi:ABC-2 type transport system permease protein|nr:ABC-2 family transporter protein [Anaerolineales bacterium]HRK87996.1 ABC-2 family transporter protein [Anaerolineales bacterium]
MKNIKFLFALWKANLQAALEFRAAFLTQIIFMMINNGAYFMFWFLYFDKFKNVRGWTLQDMMLLYGIAATAWGLAAYFFGHFTTLGEVIANGRLDYYLSLPKPVLLHVLASKSLGSGMGDVIYGIGSFILSGYLSWDGFLRYVLGVLAGVCIFISFLTIIQSLSFWLGNTVALSQIALSALLTFSLYPSALFNSATKFVLLTIIPAALVGTVPAEFVRSFTWSSLLQMSAGALIFLVLAVSMFRSGLRRYESGSAIQVEV